MAFDAFFLSAVLEEVREEQQAQRVEETIAMAEGRPVWQGHCVQCLACLHRCPVTAVQYGKKTANKGRYVNPETI